MIGKSKTEKSRPGTNSRIFGLIFLALVLFALPVFAMVKNRAPISPLPGLVFAQKSAPFSLQDLKGNTHTLKDYHGQKGLLVFFFSPGMPDFQQDLLSLNDLYIKNRMRLDRFEFIGICPGLSQAALQRAVSGLQIEYPLCPDPKRGAVKAFEVTAVPTFFVLSNKGTIKQVRVGKIRDLQEDFQQSFGQFLGIRLGIWRFKSGTEEERKAFKDSLPEGERYKVFDFLDPKLTSVAKTIPCICDKSKSLDACPCDNQYKTDMFRFINFLYEDGFLTPEQIQQITLWKYQGIEKKLEQVRLIKQQLKAQAAKEQTK